MAEARGSRAKRWCFTVNNPGEWLPPASFNEVLQEPHYMVWQREAGENGTEHIQGYVRFNKTRYLKFVKESFLNTVRAHCEVAKGSEKQNKEYCTKAETRLSEPVELGEYDEKEGQGKRSDLEAIGQKVLTGVPLRQIIEEHPGDYIRYSIGIQNMIGAVAKPPSATRSVTVYYLYGATGTGKTHRCRTQFPELYEVSPGRGPWDGYTGQSVVLFDEFNWEAWSIQEMNKYLDKWPCQLNCRYRNRYAEWTRVLICANMSYELNYPSSPQALRDAFLRRLTHTIEVVNINQEKNLNS